MTQEQQVVEALRNLGGYATLRRLYEVVDFSTWKTKTPEASVRSIVQNSTAIFRIQPGLWALEEARKSVLKKLNIKEGVIGSVERFNHSFYQGLLVEIGHYRRFTTYVPCQDQHKLFLEEELGTLVDHKTIPQFTFEKLLRKAKTVDVIWFNERNMPACFFEVEHTTDIKNSLFKFYELQDFSSEFWIVASDHRKKEFIDKIDNSIYSPIKSRVKFLSYDNVVARHSNLCQENELIW